MIKKSSFFLALVVPACGGPDDTDTPAGRCGPETDHVLSVLVAVVDEDERPVAGAQVSLQEFASRPGVRGQATTDAAGHASLQDLSITSIEGCWGIALDYRILASEGSRAAEVGVNPSLFNAIDRGESVVDRRDRPIVLR